MGLLSGGQRQSITLLMATMLRPELLLLDEHTAALDPKTAENVLQLTDKLVAEHNLTTLMITHNMRDALRFGNRLIMMDAGRIIYDVKGEEKKQLTVADLLQKFEMCIRDSLFYILQFSPFLCMKISLKKNVSFMIEEYVCPSVRTVKHV